MASLERQVIEKAAKGDIRSFEKIYAVYSSFVYNVALRIVGSHDEAEDITQEVFIRLYDKLKWFGFRSDLKTYIYRMAVNESINVYKRKKRQMRCYAFTNDAACGSVERSSIQRIEERELIDILLSKLNPEQRVCIVLREIEGLSYEEIANVLEININTVRSRLKRARERLIEEARQLKRQVKYGL